jgi:hypothetical protein
MHMQPNSRQLENKNGAIDESLDPFSIVTVERLSQSRKEFSPVVVTDEGMQIDVNPKHRKKADSSIRESREPASKITTERKVQLAKTEAQRTATVLGMQIDIPGRWSRSPQKWM